MNKIFYLLAAASVFIPAALFGQEGTVTGTVTDSSTGEPVPFVSIQIKGTTGGGEFRH